MSPNATLPADADLIRELLPFAQAARGKAYAPYSGCAVGAALRINDGTAVTGTNVENASYGLSICAERVAIAHAVSLGYRDFSAIAVAGPAEASSVPCGACRQFLSEFNPRMAVVYSAPDGPVVTRLDRIFPDPFEA